MTQEKQIRSLGPTSSWSLSCGFKASEKALKAFFNIWKTNTSMAFYFLNLIFPKNLPVHKKWHFFPVTGTFEELCINL